MQVTDGGTGRVAGEPTLEDERQQPGREARVVPGGPGGRVRGGGRRGEQVLPGDMPTARLRPSLPGAALVAGLQHTRGAVLGGKGLRGAGVPEVNGDPSL